MAWWLTPRTPDREVEGSSLTRVAIINGLICVGLVYPSSYPVDSIYKGTPVITPKNIITIMFMIPSNKRLVR